ncbi:hypothetical protein [Streptomyces noursei]
MASEDLTGRQLLERFEHQERQELEQVQRLHELRKRIATLSSLVAVLDPAASDAAQQVKEAEASLLKAEGILVRAITTRQQGHGTLRRVLDSLDDEGERLG